LDCNKNPPIPKGIGGFVIQYRSPRGSLTESKQSFDSEKDVSTEPAGIRACADTRRSGE
jgi:hypothetical protein